ncbi:MAG TPA: hypothetical protein VGF91_26890 [Solirubrobacteraceae bacterium]
MVIATTGATSTAVVHPLPSGASAGLRGLSPAPGAAISAAGDLALGPAPVIAGNRGAEHPGQTRQVFLRIPPPRVAPDVAHPIFSQFPDHCYVKE